ncbi:hypothetical protein KDW_10590 [Dictyobacter vulcani]|uniref:Uncharacterized protein n=1 Tax=Dictyobacter vulcani TaxID=2607529 RepID=A0A5J4KKC9_9CHLR|nr:hypothetical protein [Dictyobacter vulcani]GER86897.1 hypothetical protein KDW_10590 [Dictyobacter vulcani]
MDNNNNTVGGAIVKIVALTGGAIAGAILANWFDQLLSNMAHERSDFDKSRYAQGLSSQDLPAQEKRAINTEPRIIKIEHGEYQGYQEEGDL